MKSFTRHVTMVQFLPYLQSLNTKFQISWTTSYNPSSLYQEQERPSKAEKVTASVHHVIFPVADGSTPEPFPVADGSAPWDLGSHTDQITSANQWRIESDVILRFQRIMGRGRVEDNFLHYMYDLCSKIFLI